MLRLPAGRAITSYRPPLLLRASSSNFVTQSKILNMAPRRKNSSLPDGIREDKSKGAMFRFEDSLPHLPVPTLEETSKRYLKSVRGLLSSEEYAKTEKAMTDFIKPGSIGEELQKRLQARRDDPNHKNWIYEWWNDAAYLTVRDPLQYASYFYSHRDDRSRRQPAKRAAAISTAVLEFKKQVDTGSLEPEYMRRAPISMESYQWMFNCCRIPGEKKDYPNKYDPASNKHILVIRKNQFFKVQHEVNGEQLNTSELQRQFERVMERAERTPAVGVLTSENRDVWYKARNDLLAAHPANRTALEAIESASFVVCLDDAAPVTLEERAHQYWHGDGGNRWYDKPLQFIVNDNGVSGFMGEHSMMDGTPTTRLNEYVAMMTLRNKLDFSNTTVRSNLPEPLPIRFHLNDQVKNDIQQATTDFENMIGLHEVKVEAYRGYGKGQIKKFKASPDAFVQLVIQLGYHKMFGKNRPTYESAAIRKFAQGRTETTRSCTEEAMAFCNAMANSDATNEQREKLFRTAIDAHVKYSNDALNCKGVDRHLFGLKKCLREGEELPGVYKDPAYGYSSSWYLSTSQLSSEFFNGYGWSQVIDEGFGIAYMINENSIQFNIISKKLGCDRLGFFFAEAADELRDLLTPGLEQTKAKL